MESDSNWLATLLGTWSAQLSAAAEHLPGVLGAILLLVVGWLLARLVRRSVRAIASASNRYLSRKLPVGPMAAVRVSPLMITLLAEILFWIVLVVAATLALRFAGFSMIAQWLDRVAVYLPNLVAAAVILVVGILLSVFVREQLNPHSDADAGHMSRTGRWAWLGSLAQWLIVIVAVIVGLDQLGIDVGLLVALAVVCVAAATFTVGAALASGARQYTANLVGIRSARAQISVGQWLRIDDIEGQVVELSTTQIVLETELGRVLLPGHYLDEKVVMILHSDSDREPPHD